MNKLAHACYRCVSQGTVDSLTCTPCQQVFLADFVSKFCFHERGMLETFVAADLPDVDDITGPWIVERLASHGRGPFYRRNLRHKQTRQARQEQRREAGEDFDVHLFEHDHLTAPDRHRAHLRQRFLDRQAAFRATGSTVHVPEWEFRAREGDGAISAGGGRAAKCRAARAAHKASITATEIPAQAYLSARKGGRDDVRDWLEDVREDFSSNRHKHQAAPRIRRREIVFFTQGGRDW